MKKIAKIDISRQGNFILALFMIYFVFFGYLCYEYEKSIGFGLFFLNRVFFNSNSYMSIIILFLIVFYMASREQFYEYGIRNSIWLTPFIIGMSWAWYWVIYGLDITVVGMFFISWEGYLTIFSVLGINLISAILASVVKQKLIAFKEIQEDS